MKISSKLFAAAAFAVASASTMAAGLDGDTFKFQYYFPNLSSPYNDGAQGTYTVGNGVEVNILGGNSSTLDISANKIVIDFDFSASWTSTAFNGFMLSNFPVNSITGVTVDGATTDPYFQSSFISYTNNSISVNWQGMPFATGQTVVLDVATAAPVPEAGNLSMMLAGLGLFAFAARRRSIR